MIVWLVLLVLASLAVTSRALGWRLHDPHQRRTYLRPWPSTRRLWPAILVAVAILIVAVTEQPADAASDLGPGPAASDSVPDEWAMFVQAYSEEHGVTWDRAADMIGAWLKCDGGRLCRPEVEQWHRLAMEAGWMPYEWAWLSCVIYRESHGDPEAEYRGTRRRPEHSIGLLQLNTRSVGQREFYAALGFDRDQLKDPASNLAAGRALFDLYGRRPWGGRCR